MRTTVRLDPDVASAVEHLLRTSRISQSGAINLLARRGLERTPEPSTVFTQRTTDLGLTIDVSNIAEALDHLDQLDPS
ncbi:MAG: ribbon-helix-helix domain-containing protein [Propionibacteriaceae bacterium]|jgi:hypothetical protein|nr:ribbon-helix-helix domain-containing protein [Propionibacteriaceae bacterium]